MGRRVELQNLLEELLGSENVYFQPPEEHQIKYPAIVYHQDDNLSEFAGNRPYRITRRYQLTVIDQDPDSPISDKVAKLPMVTFTRSFRADYLNHFIYSLYF